MNKTLLLTAIIFAVLTSRLWLEHKPSQKPEQTMQKEVTLLSNGSYYNITSKELRTLLQKKNFVFINVHIPYEGELPQTDAFIPYDQIEKNFDKLPLDKMTKIVLYCRSGRMSAIAAQILAQRGYTNVWNLKGGMLEWQQTGYPLLNYGSR